MKNYFAILLVALAGMALASSTALAGPVINVDVNSNARVTWSATYAPTAGDFAGETFNGLNVDIGNAATYTYSSLVDAAGNPATGVSFTIDQNGVAAPDWTDDFEQLGGTNNALQRDRLYDLEASSAKFGVSGLDANKAYEISLFASCMDSLGNMLYAHYFDLLDSTGTSIEETLEIVIPAGASGNDYADDIFVEGYDYVTFEVSGSTSYTFQSRSTGAANSYPMIAGARIEAVPEPSTLVMLLGSLLGMIAWRRR